MLRPSICKMAACPLAFFQRMSALPSPLKSAAAISCQAEPGLNPTLAPLRIDVPFINHAAGVPSAFCHRISALPSPLKSPEPITCQAAPGLNPALAPDERLVPFIDQ